MTAITWILNPFTGDLTPIPKSTERVEKVPFSFDNPGTFTLQEVLAGGLLTEVTLTIKAPFDGTSSVQLGTSSNPSLILRAQDVPLGAEDQFVIVDTLEFVANDFLLFTLVATGATTGNGLLVYKYK